MCRIDSTMIQTFGVWLDLSHISIIQRFLLRNRCSWCTPLSLGWAEIRTNLMMCGTLWNIDAFQSPKSRTSSKLQLCGCFSMPYAFLQRQNASGLGYSQQHKIAPLTIQVQLANMIKYEINHPSGPMICQHHHLFFLQISKTMWPDVWTRDSPRNICVFLVTFDRLRSLCQAVVRGSSCEISCRLPYTGTFFDSTSVVTMTHLDDCYHLPSPSDEKNKNCGKWMKVGYVQNLNLALISKRTHCSTLTKNSYDIYMYIYTVTDQHLEYETNDFSS